MGYLFFILFYMILAAYQMSCAGKYFVSFLICALIIRIFYYLSGKKAKDSISRIEFYTDADIEAFKNEKKKRNKNK